jgi:hypothetical protein
MKHDWQMVMAEHMVDDVDLQLVHKVEETAMHGVYPGCME